MEKHSLFELEQIQNDMNGYRKLCNMFLGLAKDEETKSKLEEILYSGGYQDYSLSSGLSSKDNPMIEGKRRIAMAYLLVRNKETFDYFVKNNINIFHGTNANALPTILKYGLTSIDESKKEGIDVVTGERWSRRDGGRSFVSLTDVVDIAEGYSAIKPSSNSDNDLSFEVIIGTNKDEVINNGMCRVHSDVPEIGLRERLPKESIKSISVPSSKVDIVKKMVGEQDIDVLPIDDIEDKFYYIDEYGCVSIFGEKYNDLKNNINTRTDKVFGKEEINDLARGLTLSGIKTKFAEMYHTLTAKKEVVTDGRKI